MTGAVTNDSGQAKPIIVQPGAGRTIDFAHQGVVNVALDGAQTGGTLTVMLLPAMPGEGPPIHVHANDDELFLVVEGCISYLAEGRWTDVGPGGVVYFPRGAVHSFRNNGTTPACHWVITTPSGLESFFDRSAAILSRPGGPDMPRLVEVSREYGLTYPEEPQG